jgi:hypothetical protein
MKSWILTEVVSSWDGERAVTGMYSPICCSVRVALARPL